MTRTECTNASRRERYCATHDSMDRRFDGEFTVFNRDRDKDAHTKLCTFVSELFLTLNWCCPNNRKKNKLTFFRCVCAHSPYNYFVHSNIILDVKKHSYRFHSRIIVQLVLASPPRGYEIHYISVTNFQKPTMKQTLYLYYIEATIVSQASNESLLGSFVSYFKIKIPIYSFN